MKMAISIDGKIAMKSGESQWITSKYARQDVQILRAKSSAVLSSSSTIINDNALLNVRYNELNQQIYSHLSKNMFQQPIRIIIDSQNRITPLHKIINTNGKIWLIRLKKDYQKWPKNIKQIIIKEYKNKINIFSMLRFLGKSKINNVLIEAGSNLSSFFLNQKLIDEMILYIAPKILGHQEKPLCKIYNHIKLIESLQFCFQDIKKIGPDIKITLQPRVIKKQE